MEHRRPSGEIMSVRAGQPVEIYRNLNRKGLWFSARDRKSGLVVTRFDIKANQAMILEDCKLVVSKAGRARVLREKRKNVHALVRGKVRFGHIHFDDRQLIPLNISYDPYTYDSFVGCTTIGDKFKYKVTKAEFVSFTNHGVIAWVKPEDFANMLRASTCVC